MAALSGERGATIDIEIRPAEDQHFDAWRVLYDGYAAYYRELQTDEQVRRLWSWLMDPDHEVKAILAIDDQERIVGLAHYRPFARSLGASVGCFLDDLFVSPDVRGSGVADALLARLRSIARENGWSVVRWITADDNYRARAKYDQHATRTMWITYDMPVVEP